MRVSVEHPRHVPRSDSRAGCVERIAYCARRGALLGVLFELALIAAATVTLGCRGERTATIEGPPLTIAPPGDASPSPPSQREISRDAGAR